MLNLLKTHRFYTSFHSQLFYWSHWSLLWSIPGANLSSCAIQHCCLCPCTESANQTLPEETERSRKQEKIPRNVQDPYQCRFDNVYVRTTVAVWCLHHRRGIRGISVALCHFLHTPGALSVPVFLHFGTGRTGTVAEASFVGTPCEQTKWCCPFALQSQQPEIS